MICGTPGLGIFTAGSWLLAWVEARAARPTATRTGAAERIAIIIESPEKVAGARSGRKHAIPCPPRCQRVAAGVLGKYVIPEGPTVIVEGDYLRNPGVATKLASCED